MPRPDRSRPERTIDQATFNLSMAHEYLAQEGPGAEGIARLAAVLGQALDRDGP